jgi:beta-lactamase class A
MNLKRIVAIEFILIIFLLVFGTYYVIQHTPKDDFNLLSPVISSGLLPSENYLILDLKSLQNEINTYIAANSLNVSVYILNMRDGASFGIKSGISYEPASLNKLPIAMVILKKVGDGTLSLDTKLPIPDEFRDRESGTLFEMPVYEMSVRDLLSYMLGQSDDTAFKVLGSQVGLEDLHNLSAYLDYYDQSIDYIPPIENNYKITPKSTGNMFLSLYYSTVLKPEYSQLILLDLMNNSFDVQKYADIPESVKISHKYGAYFTENKSYFHDCGIMYVKTSAFFYCVMTQNLTRERASDVIGTVVHDTYDFVVTHRATDF